MNILKNKVFLCIAIILVLIGILIFRFGKDFFIGLFIVFIIALCVFLIFTEQGKLIGGFILSLLPFYFLFGKVVKIIGGIVIVAYIGLSLAHKIEIHMLITGKKKNKEAKHKAIEKLAENGYFVSILNKRLEALNANLAAIQNTEVDWGTPAPKEMWLTLDQQYEFYKENAKRMNDLELDYSDLFNTLKTYRRTLDSYHAGHFSYVRPIKRLYDDYNIDIYKLESLILENLNKYNRLYYNQKEAFFSQFAIIKSGIEGEKRVNEELALFRDIIMNIPNVRLEIEGTSVESDNILITENGIFFVEVKNFGESGKYSIFIAKDGQWIKEYEDGTIEPMKNVSAQLNRHIGLKQRFLNNELNKRLNEPDLPYIYMYPLIVIANDKVIIKNESDLPVVRASSIYRYVSNFNGMKLERKYWPVIKEIFESYNLKAKKYPINNIDFEHLEFVYPQIWEQIKAYYVFLSMLSTFEEDINHAGIYLKESDKFSKNTFNSNALPKEVSEYKHLQYKSEIELRLRESLAL